jgi:hypothetical protein
VSAKLVILRFERASKTVFLHLDWHQSLNGDGDPVYPRGAVETWTFRGSKLARELFSTLAGPFENKKRNFFVRRAIVVLKAARERLHGA